MIAAEAPGNMYGEDALHANLRSLDWVSEVAVGHEAVVEHFTRLRAVTVVPMKLLTLFSSEENAREGLRRRRSAIDAAMRRIAGCEEWGVRIFAESHATWIPAGTPGEPTTGTAFLAARKAAREAGQGARARALDAAHHTYDRLAEFARASNQRPRASEPGQNAPLLDAAFLVVVASRAEFKAAARSEADACAAAGAEMTLTGPWPAYNFVGETGERT